MPLYGINVHKTFEIINTNVSFLLLTLNMRFDELFVIVACNDDGQSCMDLVNRVHMRPLKIKMRENTPIRIAIAIWKRRWDGRGKVIFPLFILWLFFLQYLTLAFFFSFLQCVGLEALRINKFWIKMQYYVCIHTSQHKWH